MSLCSPNPQDIPENTTMLLPDKAFFHITSQILQSARHEILISTFKMELPENPKHHELTRLLTLLTKANSKLKQIKVLLHYDKDHPGRPRTNLHTAYYLQQHGIRVKHLRPGRIIHSKIILIDQKVLIIGSHNWSVSSIERNFELSILTKNTDLIHETRDIFLHHWNVSENFPKPPPGT